MRRGRKSHSPRAMRQRAARIRRRAMMIGILLLMISLAMTPPLREMIAAASGPWIAAFGAEANREMGEAGVTLEQMEIFALQLGVFDSGERAQSEMNRLTAQGIPCMIWQEEQMRIVCSAAKEKDDLHDAYMQALESCVIADVLPAVSLRLTAAPDEMDEVRRMILLPDSLFDRLLDLEEDGLAPLIAETRAQAETAAGAHPENALYTQLAQSLVSWCELMENTAARFGAARALPFARVTMCTLCRELRLMLTA